VVRCKVLYLETSKWKKWQGLHVANPPVILCTHTVTNKFDWCR